MSEPFSETSNYILNKAYFNECYSQSTTIDHTLKGYFKPIVLALFGLMLILFTSINLYAAWFIVALSAVEACSIRFHQSWWVMRQMLSKASNSEVTVLIDEEGIHSKSFYHQQDILWTEVKQFQITAEGYIVFFEGGKSYLSKHTLLESTQDYLIDKTALFKKSK